MNNHSLLVYFFYHYDLLYLPGCIGLTGICSRLYTTEERYIG